MSTRGCIAFAKEIGINQTEWEGRYHHSDSYPTGLGRELWKQFREHFACDIGAARQFFFEAHPAGFSTTLGADLLMPCGYENDYTKGYEKLPDGRPDFSKPLPHGARCFCHGDRHEKEQTWTDKDDTSDLQWLYVFAHTGYTVEMRVSRPVATGKEDAEGYSITRWQQVAAFDMSESTEPDWEQVECGKDFEYCTHVAEHHFPELSGTSMARLSVAAFLGREPLDSHDICGIQIGERRFTCSSSGCAGNDARGQDVWIASGVTPEDNWFKVGNLPKKYRNFSTYWGSGPSQYDSNRFDMIIAKTDKKTGKRVPYPGITFLYPPTCKEPLRMFAELRAKLAAQVQDGTTEDVLRRSALAGMFAVGRAFRDE